MRDEDEIDGNYEYQRDVIVELHSLDGFHAK